MKLPKLVECVSVPCRLPESRAREVDALSQTLPKNSDYAFRSKSLIEPTVALDEAERCDISYVSTPAVDHDGESVDPAGMDLEGFRQNPVVLWGHDRSQVCGKALWIKQDGHQGVLAKTYYPARPSRHDGDWLPEQVWGLTRSGILRGKSVGFLPLEVEEPDGELRAKGCRLVLKRTLLLEYSAVSIPCCPDALVQSFKGVKLDVLGAARAGRVLPKRTERIDRTGEFAKLVAAYSFNTDDLAVKAVAALKNRGRV